MFDPLAAILAGVVGCYAYAIWINHITLRERLAGQTDRPYPIHFLRNAFGLEDL